jgi:tripartite-type tricarboxylate transporter receptor subunit TctC
MHRRVFIFSSSVLLAFSAFIGSIQAQTWPARPVKMIVPYAPGGATDAVARPWADRLGQAFGQQFVVENRGGASGAIGVEAAAKSPPDGYTLLFTPSAPLSVLPHLRKTPYDPIKSFDPIGSAGDVINGFVIHPSVGVKTFAELLEYAKKNPGKLAYASSGTGTATHLRLEALKLKTGVDILHVPYRGGADSLNDLLPGMCR